MNTKLIYSKYLERAKENGEFGASLHKNPYEKGEERMKYRKINKFHTVFVIYSFKRRCVYCANGKTTLKCKRLVSCYIKWNAMKENKWLPLVMNLYLIWFGLSCHARDTRRKEVSVVQCKVYTLPLSQRFTDIVN